MPKQTVEERLRPCTNPACDVITRPVRMQAMASTPTLPRQGDGLCSGCYAAKRRAEKLAREAAAPPKPAPRVVSEEERLAQIEAGLQRFMAQRQARRARRRVSV